ncbi:hypothetical protein JCM9140_4028 [Halalkalibacter wakoensis JCM 9140]|uniref:Uncharacterized protein n=1 Tax=Halalkalibacter wakoensis JCM 9140 TaxID=1236970 RepID=W4Q7C3_9BACI|nr:hypothetical protein JCM9140_4028 [Halalkalibacter wakoensis JCM 9140]
MGDSSQQLFLLCLLDFLLSSGKLNFFIDEVRPRVAVYVVLVSNQEKKKKT